MNVRAKINSLYYYYRLSAYNNCKIGRHLYMMPGSHIELAKTACSFTFGKSMCLESGVRIKVRENGSLSLGDDVYINNNSYITACGTIQVGSHVLIGPNVMIFDHDHDFHKKGIIKNNPLITGEIVIGNNVWIGAGSIILKGAKIGNNCVIAAGSIVNKDVPSDSLFIQRKQSQIYTY